jgi:hypothetical protein
MTAEQPDDALAMAWLQHAAAVESKLDNLSHILAMSAEEIARQGDPSRYPDPFAVAALNIAAEWSSRKGYAVEELTDLADRLEAWLRREREQP